MSKNKQLLTLIGMMVLTVVLITQGVLGAPSFDLTPTSALTPTSSVRLTPTLGSTVPPEVTQYAKDWPMANRDYANTRATTDSSINSGNINTLGVAWQFVIPGVSSLYGGCAGMTPLILGNNVYFQDMKSNVFVFDKNTGQMKWQKLYNSSTTIGPYGPAIGYGKIFVLKDLYTVAALDINNGNEIWAIKLSNVATTGADIQLIVYDNLVYVSTVPGAGDVFYKPGGRGILYALDQSTGQIKWQFDTVKSADLFGHPDVNSGGGAWYPPAIDTTTGQMFWSIANPAPFPGTTQYPNGSSFVGDTLYCNSLLSMNHATGALTWYNQLLPKDIFDHDLQISPILTSANIDQKQQNVVITAGKMGNVYCLNRDTGALLWQTPVGTHTESSELSQLPAGTTFVEPSFLGGVETIMAYADGVVYVPVVNYGTNWTPTSAVGNFDPVKGDGELVAIEVNTGRTLWIQKFDYIDVAAATVVNDLVITADLKGNMYAFKRSNGQQVWTFHAPAGVNGFPAIAGDTIIWAAGSAGGSTGLNGTPTLLCFKLGLAPSPSPSASPTRTITASPSVSPTRTITPTTSSTTTTTTTRTATTTTPVTSTTTTTTSASTTTTTARTATVNLTAKNIAFNMSTISVPAGARVTVNFNNMDSGVPHNFAVYTNSAATSSIFVGSIITGPATTTYTFTAPSQAGSYYFRCDVHPTIMFGTFTVTP